MKPSTLSYTFNFKFLKNIQIISQNYFNMQFGEKVRNKFTVKPWKFFGKCISN